MRKPDLLKALQTFSSIVAEKNDIAAKECQIIDKLNRALSQTGYRIVPIEGRSMPNRRGRPRGSRNKARAVLPEASKNGVVKRGPGRPRLKKVA
ncbi:MAG TPA: hypothetical protein VFS39_16270 [Nitrospira sp.]|nr:hypothetical protein [Nitrospira sp.]